MTQPGSPLKTIGIALCVVLAFVIGVSLASRGRSTVQTTQVAANPTATSSAVRSGQLYVIANHDNGGGKNGRDAY